MVIVLLGTPDVGTDEAARTLADRIGWTYERAARGIPLRGRVERALSRREPLVLAVPAGDPAQAAAELQGLPRVRFVAFDARDTASPRVLQVDAAADLDVIVGRVRLAFGV